MTLDIDYYIDFVTPKSGDSTYSVLKAHLLVEEILNAFLDRKLNHPEALKGSRLSFAQKLCIVRAVAKTQPDHWAYKAVEQLNSIRNALAHERQPKDLQKKIRSYIDFITSNSGMPLPRPNAKVQPAETDTVKATDGTRFAAIDIATIGLYVQLHTLLEIKEKLTIAPK